LVKSLNFESIRGSSYFHNSYDVEFGVQNKDFVASFSDEQFLFSVFVLSGSESPSFSDLTRQSEGSLQAEIFSIIDKTKNSHKELCSLHGSFLPGQLIDFSLSVLTVNKASAFAEIFSA